MDNVINFVPNPNIEKVGKAVKATEKTIEGVSDVAYQMRGSLGKIAQNFGFLKEKTLQAYSAGIQDATPPSSGLFREAKSNPHTQLNFAPQPESQLQPVYYQISNDGEEVYYEDEDWPEVDPVEVKGEGR